MENLIIQCPECGTRNRIPKDRLQERPKCGKCKGFIPVDPFSGEPVTVSDRDFAREVLSSPVPVLLDCWAPWCGPCRMVAPVLEQLSRAYAGRLKVAKINVDENPRTASQYGIQSIPTLLLFKAGDVADRMVGALPKQEIERRLRALL